jgi:hypothetical protein
MQRPLLLAALACAALASSPRVARADEAEDLFDKGRKLMEDATKLDEACRTLEASLALHERGDTLLNLGECHRRQGKIASAHAEFDKALRIGASVGFGEATEVATRLRDELATKLSRVTVTVPAEVAALEGLVVELGGKPWPKERWNTAVPMDPGPIQVTAVAKGHKRFAADVALGAEKDDKTITVALEREPPPPAPPKPPPPPPPAPAAKKPVWPWVVGATGLGLAGAGVAFAFVQRGAAKELDDRCGEGRAACPAGYDFEGARATELRSFGLFVGLGAGGLVALGAAGLGLGLASRSGATTTSLSVSPTSVGVTTTF